VLKRHAARQSGAPERTESWIEQSALSRDSCVMSLSVTGLLIQAVTGRAGALGRRAKRRGFAAQAAFRTAWAFVLDRGRGADMHRVRGVQPTP
jgi:hypothetical protein